MAVVSRAALEDCLRLAEIHFDAFKPSLIHRTLFPDVSKEAHAQKLTQLYTTSIEKKTSEVFKASISDGQGGEKLVGVAFWDLPKEAAEKDEEDKKEAKKSEEEKLEEAKKRFPEGTNLELAMDFFGRLDPKVDEPFFHLHILAIDPTVQRTGAGAKLLNWGCREADKQGVACYLEATAEGIGLYRKYGYEMFAEPIIGGENGELILWPMRRPPLELRQFRRSDFAALSSIYHDAFAPTASFRYNFPNVTREAADHTFHQRLESWYSHIYNQDDDTCSTDKKEVIVGTRGEKTLGFAVWEKVPDQAERPASPAPSLLPEGANLDRAPEYFRLIREAANAYEKKHWYLLLLTILPELQGGGIGRLMTEWGIERARKDGADVVLGSTELGRPLYQSLGFVDLNAVVAPQDPSVINWTMVLRA